MKKIFVILHLLLGFGGLQAQVLTLKDAVNIALRNSLDIQIAKNNEVASKINNAGGVALALPQVTASLSDNQSLTNLSQKLNNGTNINRPNNANNVVNAGVAANMLVFNGFRVQATRSRLLAIERQNTDVVKTQIQNIVANVVIKYYDIVRQQGYIKTIEQSISVTQKQKEIIEVRKSVGLANNADIYQSQLDLNASLQEMQSQVLTLMLAKTDLMNLLTQKPDSTFDIRDTIVVDASVSIDSVKAAIKRNPEVLSAEEQIRINTLIVKEVGAQRYPSVSVTGGYNYARSQSSAGNFLLNQNFGPFVGFNVAVPIFNGGMLKRQQQVATIDIKNAENSRTILINNLLTNATKAWQAYQNNLQRINTEQENNKIADSLLQLTLIRYQYNMATIVEVKEAQRSFVEAGYRLVNLTYAAKLAEVELKRMAGMLAL